MIRFVLMAIGALALLGVVYTLIQTVGMPEGTRAPGLIAMVALASVMTLAFVLNGVLGDIEQLRGELDALRVAQPSTPAEQPAAAPAESAGDAASRAAEAEAAALMKTAEDHHFAKDFAAALAVYRDVVARYAETKHAGKAKQQIANLEAIA